MWRFVKDIFDWTNIFGMTRNTPIPVFTSGVRLFCATDDPTINNVNGTNITVYSTKNGTTHIDTYDTLVNAGLAVSSDATTEIQIVGNLTGAWAINSGDYIEIEVSDTAITSLDASNNIGHLTNIVLHNNTSLVALDCNDCTSLVALDLSGNSYITSLNCGNCPAITFIYFDAYESQPSGEIAQMITNALTTTGVWSTSNAVAPYYSVVETAANNKGWTIFTD